MRVDLVAHSSVLSAEWICEPFRSVKLEHVNGYWGADNINPCDGLALIKSEGNLFGLAAFRSSTRCPFFSIPGSKTHDSTKHQNEREVLLLCPRVRQGYFFASDFNSPFPVHFLATEIPTREKCQFTAKNRVLHFPCGNCHHYNQTTVI